MKEEIIKQENIEIKKKVDYFGIILNIILILLGILIIYWLIQLIFGGLKI